MNQNIKALLSRGMLAVQAVEESRKSVGVSVKLLAENPNTKRAIAGFLGSITPRGLSAAIELTENLALVYEEVATKIHILNQAMPGIAEALEAAGDAEGVIPVSELIAAGSELEAEAAETKFPKIRVLACSYCKKEDPYLAPELKGVRCRSCKEGYMAFMDDGPESNKNRKVSRAAVTEVEEILHDSVERATTSLMGDN